jgi:hypothetical protein
MVVEQSIFKSTKLMLGIAPDDDSFDAEVTGYINAALSDLVELGAGPPNGLFVTGDGELWAALNESPSLTERIKNWVYLKVRLFWDPPQTSFLLDAHQRQIDEATWRIVNGKDGDRYLANNPQYIDPDDTLILDGSP